MSTRRKIIRYSESFKQQVIDELESGEYDIPTLRSRYGIRGTGTIQRWARKYGRFNSLPKVIRVEKPNEREEIRALRAEIKRLKEALADQLLDKVIAESTLEVICEQRGWDIEEIKKKAEQLLAARQKRKGKH